MGRKCLWADIEAGMFKDSCSVPSRCRWQRWCSALPCWWTS